MANESLKVVAGNASGSTIQLDNELVIGRSTPGLGSLGGDSEISRVHARVYRDASGQLTVEDLGSTNGTYVNGNRISSATPLRPGDQLRVGQTTMSVEGGAADLGATNVGAAIVPPPAAASPPPPQAVAASPPTQPLPPAQPPQSPPPPGGGPLGGGPVSPGAQPAGGPVGQRPGKASGGPPKGLLIGLGLLVIAGLVVAGLFIGGVIGGDDDEKTVTVSNTQAQTTPAEAMPAPEEAMPEPEPEPTEEPPSTEDGGYPPGFGDKFVEGCASSGRLTESQCQCWFDRLSELYTFEEFQEVLQQAQGGSIPPEAENALRECVS